MDDLWLAASQILPIFVYPVGLSLELILLGLFAWRMPVASKSCFFAAAIVLWLSSTPYLAARLYSDLEGRYPPVALHLSPTADVAIVLGGAIGQPIAPRTYLDLSDAADRVWHAARLYRAGKVTRIHVSAGNAVRSPAEPSEAQLIAELLGEWGVPLEAITIDGDSRNTLENAIATRAAFDKEGWTSALLVTSAAHMPRALALFVKAGLPVTPSPTDVLVVGRLSISLFDLLPQVEALAMTTTALKERIGYLVYHAAGRI